MIELITRQAALINPVFASFIYQWQKRFDPTEEEKMELPAFRDVDPSA
jgi:hypothetical protein